MKICLVLIKFMYDDNVDDNDEDEDDNVEEDTFGHNVWWCVQDITPCHRPAWRHLPPSTLLFPVIVIVI